MPTVIFLYEMRFLVAAIEITFVILYSNQTKIARE
jgi:hypothetical protein